MSHHAYASRDSPPSHTLLDQNLDPRVVTLRLAQSGSLCYINYVPFYSAICLVLTVNPYLEDFGNVRECHFWTILVALRPYFKISNFRETLEPSCSGLKIKPAHKISSP